MNTSTGTSAAGSAAAAMLRLPGGSTGAGRKARERQPCSSAPVWLVRRVRGRGSWGLALTRATAMSHVMAQGDEICRGTHTQGSREEITMTLQQRLLCFSSSQLCHRNRCRHGANLEPRRSLGWRPWYIPASGTMCFLVPCAFWLVRLSFMLTLNRSSTGAPSNDEPGNSAGMCWPTASTLMPAPASDGWPPCTLARGV